MTDTNHDLLDIVTQIRFHLEYLQALGVRHIEVAPPQPATGESVPREEKAAPLAQQPAVRVTAPAPAKARVLDQKPDLPVAKKETVPSVSFEGSSSAAVMFIGVSVRKDGRPFEGSEDKLLTDIIEKGMKLKRGDIAICGIAPEGSRESWEPALKAKLAQVKPRVLVALGQIASKTLLNTSDDIETLRGKWNTYGGIPLMPTYDPARMLQNPQDKKPVWEDIQQVMGKLK